MRMGGCYREWGCGSRRFGLERDSLTNGLWVGTPGGLVGVGVRV